MLTNKVRNFIYSTILYLQFHSKNRLLIGPPLSFTVFPFIVNLKHSLPMSASESDAAIMEQIITEFFLKSLHIILDARTPCVSSHDLAGEKSGSSSSSSSVRRRDKWFNLALKECPVVFKNLGFWYWRNPKSMIVDVILNRRVLESVYGDHESTKEGEKSSEQIIERWVVKYEVRRTESGDSNKGKKRSSKSILSSLYKKSIILLRSLYTTVRLLPASKLFRRLSISSGRCSCFLAHRVSSSADPLDPKEEAKMQLHGFAPLDTSYGKIQLSVIYLSRIPEVQPQASLRPIASQFIQNYVENSLAEPVKWLPLLLQAQGSFPLNKYTLTSNHHCLLSSPSFTQSHSSTPTNPCPLPLPRALLTANYSDRVTDKTSRLMQAGLALNKISFLRGDKMIPDRKFQDDSSDSNITCAFDISGIDPMNLTIRTSDGAALGTLVDTFGKAQPLRRPPVQKITVANAFKEFQGFLAVGKSLEAGRLSGDPKNREKENP
ncbi:hypothetical protein SAY87_017119 [Trapa incisa]|uniref:Autophagy-related protein 13 N-terminal domain-containing protein n=1 Tax=Trapa incisa TaxID=236973 RepID=A0AAN7LDJ7_9MYRT|nr:hypothetical protein SAY87_017119 [Trapa incisa]